MGHPILFVGKHQSQNVPIPRDEASMCVYLYGIKLASDIVSMFILPNCQERYAIYHRAPRASLKNYIIRNGTKNSEFS